MGEDKHRTIERSKPNRPPPGRRRGIGDFWQLPQVKLFRTRRGHFLGLFAFFLLGTIVGVLFGPSSRPTPPPPVATNDAPAPPVRATPPPADREKSTVRLRAYAFTSPAPDTGEESAERENSTARPTVLEERPQARSLDSVPGPGGGARQPSSSAGAGAPVPQWLAYAVPEPAESAAPRIALVIDDLGIDQARTRRAIALPGPLTMAFLPYGYNLGKLSALARDAGHELIVHLPMQPQDDDANPGPNALLRFLAPDELRARIAWNLSRFEGFVGINNHMGSGFTRWDAGVTILMEEIRGRGLLFLDSLTSRESVAGRVAGELGVPFAVRDVFLDNEQEVVEIRRQLDKLEEIARKRGYAIGIGHPHDTTIETLRAWLAAAKARGLSIVPLSTIVRQRHATG